ncbi:MAG: tetratricopeptide repeat protein, partial [Ignavibacteriaceae bacterium]|nr:tetratricopeptide repeat protein [Ignavibacteriaceae bacterium]
IIGSLVSNLKDQKPLVSVNNSEYEAADAIYKRAQTQLKLEKISLADSLFRYAKDLDALRFRAPEKINSIIKELAIKYQYVLVNIDSAFNANSPDRIVGNNLIVDHLHPSLGGHLLMGKIYFEAMEKFDFLPEGNRLQITDLDRDSIVIKNFAFSRLDSVISKIRLIGLMNDWPFVEKPDFSFLKGIELKDKIDSLAYKVAVENTNWEKAHSIAVSYYLSKKDYQNFAKEMHVVVSQYPFKLEDYDFAASQLINAKEYDLSLSFLKKRYKEAPDAFSTKWLGSINLNKGKADDAIKFFQESIQYNKSDAQVFYNLAGAYVKKNDYLNALTAIKNCMKINPDFPSAKNLETQLTKLLNQ